MPGKTVGIQMNLGYPGTYSRNGDCLIAARLVAPTDANGPGYGDPVVLNPDGSVSSAYDFIVGSSGTLSMSNFYGTAVREVKSFTSYANSPSLGGYIPGGEADILKRGNIMVVVNRGSGAISAGSAVYIRKTLGVSPDAGAVIGGYEGDVPADSGTSLTLTNAHFVGNYSTDANGYVIAEIEFNMANLP